MPSFSPLNAVKTEGNDEELFRGVDLEENTGSANVKEEPQEEGAETPAKAAITPSKRGRKKATEKPNDGEDGTPSKRAKAAGNEDTPSKKKLKLPPIPTSLENAGEADLMIIRLKDEENKTWGEINKAYENMIGTNLSSSTARKRYTSMKNNFTVFPAEDEARLLQGKKEVEDKLEQEKWGRIADWIEAKGGAKYSAGAIHKKWKEISKKGVTAAVKDSSED